MPDQTEMRRKAQEEIAKLKSQKPKNNIDGATAGGLILAICVLGGALFLGGQASSFINTNALLIVLGGTLAVTTVSFSLHDIWSTQSVLRRSLLQQNRSTKELSRLLLDLSSVSKKYGTLVLQDAAKRLRYDPFLYKSIIMVSDNIVGEEIERILSGEVNALIERHQHSIDVLRRAAEVAPAMGLIGTLVGLVQMLATLDDPSTIGPSMAVALLTTFYGAVFGTVILSPLAVKLEHRSSDDVFQRKLILIAAISMAKHENPRKLEMLINSYLPASERIVYFKD